MKRREFFKFLPALPAAAAASALGIQSNPNVIETSGNLIIQNCIFTSSDNTPGLTITNAKPKL